MDRQSILQRTGGKLIQFSKENQTTTAAIVRDDSGNPVNYSCHGIAIQNLSSSVSIKYSFDGTIFYEIKPLGSISMEVEFDKLYVKSASSTASYQGQLIKAQ